MDPDLDPTADSDRSVRLPCRSRPVLARPSRGWTLLLTDAGPCFRIGRGGPLALEPLPDLAGCSSVAVDPGGTLVVGLYDAMLATLRDGEWDHRPTDAPVLCLAATQDGVAVGDSAGTVTFRDAAGTGAKAGVAVVGEPVADLVPFDRGLVALGTRGGLWRLGWPEGGTVPTDPIAPREGLGRLLGLFDAGSPGHVGAFDRERVALIEGASRRFAVGTRRFPAGIGVVVSCSRGRGERERGGVPLGLLTDDGEVWLVGADLKSVAPVVPPGGPEAVAGLAPGANDGLLAWTATGTVFSIGRDRSVRTLATGDAVFAYPDPDSPDQVAVVHWQPDRGIQIRRVWPEPAR
jgi:hypothetical protein